MAIQFGRNAYIQVGKNVESTYGDGGTGFDIDNRIFSCSLLKVQNREQVTHLTSSDGGFARTQFAVSTEVTGTIELPLFYEGTGCWLKYGIGSVSSSAGPAPFVHTFSPVIALPSFGAKFQRGTGGSEWFKGLMVSTLGISCSAGEEARLTVELIGQDSAARAGSLGAPTFGTGSQVLHNQAESAALRYTPDGGTLQTYTIRSFDFLCDNKLERRDRLGSLTTASPDSADLKEVTISIVAEMEDEVIYNHQLDGTSGELQIIFQSGTDELKIKLHNAVVMSYEDTVSSVGRLERNFSFKGFASSSGEAFSVQVHNASADPISN